MIVPNLSDRCARAACQQKPCATYGSYRFCAEHVLEAIQEFMADLFLNYDSTDDCDEWHWAYQPWCEQSRMDAARRVKRGITFEDLE